jgi:molybdopterin-guanine dinucleotide biosynthesis protein A
MGSDKTAAALGETTVLDRLLDAIPASWPVVAVGGERPTRRHITWTQEAPPQGGPVAAVAAGLRLVRTELVVVLAGDMPFAAEAARRLATALDADRTTDAVIAVDRSGRPNPLLAAYRTAPLAAALPDPTQGVPARALLAVTHCAHLVPEEESLDVDTPEALADARHRLEP